MLCTPNWEPQYCKGNSGYDFFDPTCTGPVHLDRIPCDRSKIRSAAITEGGSSFTCDVETDKNGRVVSARWLATHPFYTGSPTSSHS